jgi:hypothetical protein
MVERVARGRIMVPAAAALTVMAAGLMKPQPVAAAGREATLQIRVQVVEPCRIRLAPSGALDHACGAGGSLGQTPVSVQLSALVEQLARPPLPGAIATPVMPSLSGSVIAPASPTLPLRPHTVSVETANARLAAANQRANDVVERITQRVRHITVAY